MNWLVDTSAWGRLPGDGAAAAQVQAILDADPGSELVLSPVIALELLRGPRGPGVATQRRRLEDAYLVLSMDGETFRLAAAATEALAAHEHTAHRVPIPDLLTAALAHQHGCGVVHCDDHYELLSRHAGLTFPTLQLDLGTSATSPPPTARQRALKAELHQVLSRLPIADAEEFLEAAVQRARQQQKGSP